MYNVSNYFFTDIAKYGRQFDNQILVNGRTEPITVYDINIFKHRFNANLFQSVMRTIEADTNVKIEKNSIITGKIGIKFEEDNPYNYISYNNYKVLESSEYDEDTRAYITLAYDKMREAMIPYDLTPTFPITVRNFLILLCNRLNWSTSNIPTTFINSEKQILSNVFANINYTFRDVLDEIAKITCSFPCFINGNFSLKYITETGKTINNDYLKEDNLNFIKEYYVNSVVFARAEDSDTFYRRDETDIAQNGLHEYKLTGLQILSQENRSDYIDEIYNYLRTLKFWIFDIQTTGVFIFDIADRFTIEIGNSSYSVVLLNSEGVLEQGLSEQMYSDEPKGTETEYQYSTSDEKQDNLTKIMVDKQNQIIQATVERVDEAIEEINNSVVSVQVLYALSNSTTVAPTTGWNEQAPEWTNDKYMWQKTVTEYQDGTIEESIPTCISGAKGSDGKGVSNIIPQYYLSTSNTQQTGGEWTETQVEWEENKFIWTRSKITFTDNTITYTTPVLATEINNVYQQFTEYKTEQQITDQSIIDMVSKTETKITNELDGVKQEQNTIKTQYTQTSNSFEQSINELTRTVEENNGEVNERINEINNYFRYELEDGVGVVKIGRSNSDIILKLKNDKIYFEQNGEDVAYISNNKLYITKGEFLESLQLGNFAFMPRENGSLSFGKVGE